MKPGFALILSHEGIGLLQRAPDGWLAVGEVKLDSPDMPKQLSELRDTTQALAMETGDGQFSTKLVLPNSEILYDTIELGDTQPEHFEDKISAELEGRTPYNLSELSFDYVVSGSTAQIAVVARETLAEAEAFAEENRFAPVCFAAIPPKGAFSGEPLFGTTRAARDILGDDTKLERDAVPVVIVGAASVAEARPVFSSRRAGTPDPAAEPGDSLVADVAPRIALDIPPEPAPEQPLTLGESDRLSAPTARQRPGSLALAVAAGVALILIVVGVLSLLPGDKTPDNAESTDSSRVVVEADPEPSALTEVTGLPSGTSPEGATTVVAGEDQQASLADPADLPPAPGTDTLALDTTPPEPSRAPQVSPEIAGMELTPFDALPTREESAEGIEAATEETVEALPAAPTRPTMRPSLVETETFYATQGIWQRSPDPVPQPETGDLKQLYVASLDPAVTLDDALALPAYAAETDLRPVTPLPPVGPGQVFEFGEDGLVEAGPDGTLNPDGVRVFSEAAGPRPTERPSADEALVGADPALAGFRPKPRPDNAAELIERAQLRGRTNSELAAFRPKPRPDSVQQAAEAKVDRTPTSRAVAQSPSPRGRPSNMAVLVARAKASQKPAETPGAGAAIAAAPQAPAAAPAIPTTASVARQATIKNALSVGKINLLGVYGAPSKRRALVLLSSGRYVKVEVGDRLDGGRVASIGKSSLQYTKSGRNVTLKMPKDG